MAQSMRSPPAPAATRHSCLSRRPSDRAGEPAPAVGLGLGWGLHCAVARPNCLMCCAVAMAVAVAVPHAGSTLAVMVERTRQVRKPPPVTVKARVMSAATTVMVIAVAITMVRATRGATLPAVTMLTRSRVLSAGFAAPPLAAAEV